jgi:hypothetical protein
VPKIRKKITISCSINDVWGVLTSFHTISDWANNVSHSCFLSEQKIGVGTVRRIQTGNNTVTEHVTVWEELASLGYEIRGLPPVFKKVTNTWFLSPHERGTELSLEIEIIPIRRPATPVAGLGCLAFARINNGMLSDLKEFLENMKPLNDLKEEILLLSSRLNQLESDDV